MQDLDLVIFDLAGTTVVDDGQVPSVFTAALSKHGFNVTPQQIKNVRGSSKRQAILQFIPPGADQSRIAEEVYATFRENLIQQYAADPARPVPASEQLFHILRERGVKVALNTGFDRDTTALLLAALAWDSGRIDAAVCADEVPQGRPAPYMIFRTMQLTGATDVHKVANVGDTILDLQAGYHAGLRWNIGVLSGAHDRPTLESAPHTHILNSVAELNSIWGEI